MCLGLNVRPKPRVCRYLGVGELLQTGVRKATGVLGPEAFDPDPFMDMMSTYDLPGGLKEMIV